MSTLNVVIDTNVIYSALRSKRGASHLLLSLIGAGKFDTHLSVPLVLEYEAVLLRKIKSLSLTREDISDFIDSLCALSHHHEIYFLWRPYLRDPKDELILELAIKARCEYIITYNRSDFAGSNRFGIQVLTPKEFLKEIGELS